MNALHVIHPYKVEGTWVFDDERVGLVREPFIAGADTIIDRMVATLPDAEQGFRLVFSARPFPGNDMKLTRRREEDGGHWYESADLALEGWLCPALLKYFDDAPLELYAQFSPKAP
ncbi:MAG: DUF6717 family protein [Planctomycetota bacterium]|jgi:hypothetical protein